MGHLLSRHRLIDCVKRGINDVQSYDSSPYLLAVHRQPSIVIFLLRFVDYPNSLKVAFIVSFAAIDSVDFCRISSS